MQTENSNTQGHAVLGSVSREIPLKELFSDASDAVILTGTAEENQENLRRVIERNPGLLNGLPNGDLADLLEKISGLDNPDVKVLEAIYKAYNPDEAEIANTLLIKQIAFLDILQGDAEVQHFINHWPDIPDEEKMAAAEHLHQLHAESYGFKPATLEPCIRPPVGEVGQQRMSYGSYDRVNNIIYYNTYQPKPDDMIPTFRKGFVDFAATILHEGDHVFQNEMVKQFQCGKLKDSTLQTFARIMRDSVQGPYYLDQPRVEISVYLNNPSEKHAYKFQEEMEVFLNHGSLEIISKPGFSYSGPALLLSPH